MLQRFRMLCVAGVLATGLAPALAAEAGADAGDEGRCERVGSFTTQLVSGDVADVYHPLPARGPAPVIAFLQGGLTDKGLYTGYASELACAGYVVVVPNRFAALFPGQPPQIFTSQQVINHVLDTMVLSNANAGSPLFGAVDTARLGVAGHSFGGAAALFAIEGSCRPPFCFGFFTRPPQMKAAVVFGVNTIGQGGVLLDVDTSAVPVAMIHGDIDGRATLARAIATFGILERSKAFITIEGINHWGIIDLQNPAGNTPDPNVQTRPQDWGIAKTAKYSRIVFDAYVKGDAGALRKLRRGQAESGVQVQFVE
jgi:dienelactone hydrolase